MEITGKHFIGYKRSGKGKQVFKGLTAYPGDQGHSFHIATASEINAAFEKANTAFHAYSGLPLSRRADFLRAIALEIEQTGDLLIQTAMQESGLPEGRIAGERGRTTSQLRLFADFIEEGSWVNAIIDKGDPGRTPLPKPDIRRMLVPTGPVVVFTASNFPLAFSTAGGDTASALATGCPVIVKGHEAHPATHELVSGAITRAALQTGIPDGTFSSLHGNHQTGKRLVNHPLAAAVAFTGSFKGGKALFDLAQKRPQPIPVFAEMGSVNPVVILPGALRQHAAGLASQIAGSVSLGAGQFCTNPGLIFLPEQEQGNFVPSLVKQMEATAGQCMLNRSIFENYRENLESLFSHHEVELLHGPSGIRPDFVLPAAAITRCTHFLKYPRLQEEIFGPFTLLVTYQSEAELLQLIRSLKGQLTASIFCEDGELFQFPVLQQALLPLVGRLILNGVPTGVEVCHAMQHGGPFPATTDSRFTSVGTAAIQRFVRPVAYQNFPEELLPPALQSSNPLQIWRMVDGKMTR